MPLAVRIAMLSFATAYSLYAVVRHWQFRTSGYDLGVFDQATWRLSRLEAPASSFAGYQTIFSDHFHPILLLLTPITGSSQGPRRCWWRRPILLAATLLPVFAYSRTRVGI